MSYRPHKITWEDVRKAVEEADKNALAEREWMKKQLKEAREDLLIPLREDEDGI